MSGMISVINAFQNKLKLWIVHFRADSLSPFLNLRSITDTASGGVCNLLPFVDHLETLEIEFGKRFNQFSVLETVMFISNPFNFFDGESLCKIFGGCNL